MLSPLVMRCRPTSFVAVAAAIGLVVLRGGTAHAQSDPESPAHALPRSEFGLRLNLAGAAVGKELDLAPTGLRVDAGRRITDHWYLGGIGSTDMYIANLGGDGAFTSRLQLGVEARYLVSDSSGSMRINHGPSRAIPSLGWLSLSAGYETFGFAFGNVRGAFASVGYVSELYVSSSFNLGMFYSLGATYDVPEVYGSGSVVHATGELGFRFGWGG